MIGRLPGDPFVFVEFKEGGGVLEVAELALGAVGLDLAELVEALLELAGKAVALDADGGHQAMASTMSKVISCSGGTGWPRGREPRLRGAECG